MSAIMRLEQSASVLRYVWQQWREIIGPRSKEHYANLVQYHNLGARLNGYSDAGALWRSPYEMSKPLLAKDAVVDLEEVGIEH